MVNKNIHNVPPDSVNSYSLLDASATLSGLRDLTEQELLILERWCENLPIDSDARDRIARIVDQVSMLRLKR